MLARDVVDESDLNKGRESIEFRWRFQSSLSVMLW